MSSYKNSTFDKKKEKIVNSTDLSRKGNIDEAIEKLVNLINSHVDYVTTSSCSGRIIVLTKGEGEFSKKGCKWILTSHTEIDPNDAVEQISSSKEKNMILKFEPFILHVKCSDIKAAKKMQDCANAAGYRNSGSVFGRQGSITLAVRGPHGLEVPLSDQEDLIVSKEYIKYVINKANVKMCENLKRVDTFSKAVFKMLAEKDVQETRCDKNE